MKKFIHLPAALLLLTCSFAEVSAQDTTDLPNRIIDMKLQLIEARQKLLEMKIEMLEKKPQFVDSIIEIRVDTIIRVIEDQIPFRKDKVMRIGDGPVNIVRDTMPVKPVKRAITWNVGQIAEGTLQLGYEQKLKDNLSLNFELSGTYATLQGFGGGYLENQTLSFFDGMANSYVSYNGQMIRALGISVRLKNYLLARVTKRISAPLGLYAAPQLMYRRVWITGNNYDYDIHAKREITANLDIIHGGVIIGGKFAIAKVICIDIYAGGVLRLAKYYNESTITRYKKWHNVDYSGVMPTAGINIGILK